MKKTLLILILFIWLVPSVMAVSAARPFLLAQRQNTFQNLKQRVKALGLRARITGTISSINGNNLTVSANNKSYQVEITDKTALRRKFWGKANLSEFFPGDQVNVIGRFTDSSGTIINAVLVRDTSVQIRWGVFLGDVVSKTNDNFVIKITNHGNQTVYFDSNTKFVNSSEKAINYSDLQAGNRVRVKGTWNNKFNTIKSVSEVKDFSVK